MFLDYISHCWTYLEQRKQNIRFQNLKKIYCTTKYLSYHFITRSSIFRFVYIQNITKQISSRFTYSEPSQNINRNRKIGLYSISVLGKLSFQSLAQLRVTAVRGKIDRAGGSWCRRRQEDATRCNDIGLVGRGKAGRIGGGAVCYPRETRSAKLQRGGDRLTFGGVPNSNIIASTTRANVGYVRSTHKRARNPSRGTDPSARTASQTIFTSQTQRTSGTQTNRKNTSINGITEMYTKLKVVEIR